jgi:hypothetical protein
MEIQIPHKFIPRDYQLPLFEALDRGVKRAILVWHRRAGKDKACWNYMIKRAFERVGTYFYFLPEYSQAKKVIWDNIDNDGFRMLDHIPQELIAGMNATELKITLKNGSIIQLIGADNFSKSGVGTNPIGVVLSEYSINDPKVWNFIRPILAVNKGWAIFNFTPRGQNHAYEMLEMAKSNPEWFVQVLTVRDTGILSDDDIARERNEGMSQAMIDQEFYCKFIESATSFFKDIPEVCSLAPEIFHFDHRFQMGVDLARYNDFTAISVIDLNTFKQVYLERFNQLDWNLQKAKIEGVYYRFGQPKGFIDATGVGDPIVDDLNNRGINLQPYKFNETNRKDLLNNLSIKMEQRKIKLLDDPILKDELGYFQYEMSEKGKLRIKVPDQLHDDTVFATGLSVWDLPDRPLRVVSRGSSQQTQGVSPMYSEFGI